MKTKRTVVHTFISTETKIKGDIEFSGNIRIDSEVSGNIIGREGLLIIGEKGRISGDIKAEAIVVMGMLDGTVEALDSVEVAASGKVTGNIYAPNVNFEPGSVFVGRCSIGANPVKHETNTAVEEKYEEPASATVKNVSAEQIYTSEY